MLTKPLGAGAVATAIKRGLADDALVARAIEVMTTLNDRAAEQARAAGAHALTDVTGFGLLGHLHELAAASGVAAEIDARRRARDRRRARAAGDRRRGRRRLAPQPRLTPRRSPRFADDVPEARRRLVCDAMTSGGLLAAVPPERAGEIDGAVVGRLVPGEPGTIAVR